MAAPTNSYVKNKKKGGPLAPFKICHSEWSVSGTEESSGLTMVQHIRPPLTRGLSAEQTGGEILSLRSFGPPPSSEGGFAMRR